MKTVQNKFDISIIEMENIPYKNIFILKKNINME